MNYTKVIGFIIYILLLVLFLVGLIYFVYFSKDIEIIKEQIESNTIRGLICFILMGLGVVKLSEVYRIVVEFIFCPLTKEEIKLKKKRKILFRKYPRRIAILKYQEFKKEMELNKIRNKIEDNKNE